MRRPMRAGGRWIGSGTVLPTALLSALLSALSTALAVLAPAPAAAWSLDDFRISDAGGKGDASFGSFEPVVVFNSTENEYLVVWRADDPDAEGVINGEYEIFGQRIDALTGEEVGANDFRISDVGGSGSTLFGARDPAVAFNPDANEYLVVWKADDVDSPGMLNGEEEIFGQRIDGATGAEVGENDFRISDAGGTGVATIDAVEPDVAYNSSAGEYLVVWRADDVDSPGILNGEEEIFGQRIDGATGAEVGENDFRISDTGGNGGVNFDARDPRVVYNSTADEYLVVWGADDIDSPGVVSGEEEIFGQRLDGDTGAEVGENDFRISDAGGTGDGAFDAWDPDLVYNPAANEYLVVWRADDVDGPGVVDNEFEIYGQRLDGATGAEVGVNDFRISDAGGTGTSLARPVDPQVVFNPDANVYFVVWEADDTDTAGIINAEYEIFGQWLDGGNGAEIGINDVRLSDVGGTGSVSYQADHVGVAFGGDGSPLVVWSADDVDHPGNLNGELEIFGRIVSSEEAGAIFVDGFEPGDLTAWSVAQP